MGDAKSISVVIAIAAAILVAGTTLALAADGGASGQRAFVAAVPPKKCGKVKAEGRRYVVKSHRVKCRFARRWSKKVIKGKGKPRGWSCQRYSKKQTRIAFICRKAGKDFFAIRQ